MKLLILLLMFTSVLALAEPIQTTELAKSGNGLATQGLSVSQQKALSSAKVIGGLDKEKPDSVLKADAASEKADTGSNIRIPSGVPSASATFTTVKYPEKGDATPNKLAAPDKQVAAIAVLPEVGCIPLGMTRNSLAPPDLFKRVSSCIAQENYDEAARLFALAGIYSIFDAQRIADKRAIRARKVLIAGTFSTISHENKKRFAEAQKRLEMNPVSRIKLCHDVKLIGMPNYSPGYLIAHSRSVPANPDGQPILIRNFKPEKEWKTLRALYLGCPV